MGISTRLFWLLTYLNQMIVEKSELNLIMGG